MLNKLVLFLSLVIFFGCKKEMNYQVEYYDNGDTLSFYTMKDGQKHGEYRLYFEGNELKEKGSYKENHLIGTKKAFYPDGKLKEYYFYDISHLPIYYKRFNENGELEHDILGVASSLEMYQDVDKKEDSVLIGYKLAHTMYKDVRISLVIYNLNANDTVLFAGSDTTFIRYYLKGFEEGLNRYHISVYEVLNEGDQVKGRFYDTLKINVGGRHQKI